MRLQLTPDMGNPTMAALGAVPAIVGASAGTPQRVKRKRRSEDGFRRGDIVCNECVLCPRALSGEERSLNLVRLLSISDAPVDFHVCGKQCTKILQGSNLGGKRQKVVLEQMWRVVAEAAELRFRVGETVQLKEDVSAGRNVLPAPGKIVSITCDADLGARYLHWAPPRGASQEEVSR